MSEQHSKADITGPFAVAYQARTDSGDWGPPFLAASIHRRFKAEGREVRKLVTEEASDQYAAKRFADGVNAAVADMLPELERVRAALASQAVPTIASLIERFGDVPGELEVCGDVSVAKAAPQAEQQAERRLTRKARVGGTLFEVGVPERLVLDAAQLAAQRPQGLIDDSAKRELQQLIADNAGRAAFLDAHPAVSQELSDLIEENERLRAALAAHQAERNLPASFTGAAKQLASDLEALSVKCRPGYQVSKGVRDQIKDCLAVASAIVYSLDMAKLSACGIGKEVNSNG